jgi:hypothetical protein
MKANELRLGNWVINKRGEYYMVSFIDSQIDVTPIPLTRELLTKAGFKTSLSNPNIWLLRIGDTNLMLRDGEAWTYAGPISLQIKYVHQLQNLHFALTGEELEFKQPATPHTGQSNAV